MEYYVYALVDPRSKGRIIPEDERQRMLANKPPMTDEYRAKISASKKGKPWSEARRAAQARKKGKQ